jgi:hypothetical protein
MRSLLTPQGLHGLVADLGLSEDQRTKLEAFARGAGWMDDRVSFAMHLLDLKTPRPVIRDRLVALYEISREHAYRIIRAAIYARQKCVMEMAQAGFIVKAD